MRFTPFNPRVRIPQASRFITMDYLPFPRETLNTYVARFETAPAEVLSTVGTWTSGYRGPGGCYSIEPAIDALIVSHVEAHGDDWIQRVGESKEDWASRVRASEHLRTVLAFYFHMLHTPATATPPPESSWDKSALWPQLPHLWPIAAFDSPKKRARTDGPAERLPTPMPADETADKPAETAVETPVEPPANENETPVETPVEAAAN